MRQNIPKILNPSKLDCTVCTPRQVYNNKNILSNNHTKELNTWVDGWIFWMERIEIKNYHNNETNCEQQQRWLKWDTPHDIMLITLILIKTQMTNYKSGWLNGWVVVLLTHNGFVYWTLPYNLVVLLGPIGLVQLVILDTNNFGKL